MSSSLHDSEKKTERGPVSSSERENELECRAGQGLLFLSEGPHLCVKPLGSQTLVQASAGTYGSQHLSYSFFSYFANKCVMNNF